MNRFRIFITIFLFLSIIILPYWIYLPCIALAIIFYPFYWEGLMLAFVVDAMYGKLGLNPKIIIHTYAVWSLVLIALIIPLRRRIRNYA